MWSTARAPTRRMRPRATCTSTPAAAGSSCRATAAVRDAARPAATHRAPAADRGCRAGFGLLERVFGRTSWLVQPNAVYGLIFYAFVAVFGGLSNPCVPAAPGGGAPTDGAPRRRAQSRAAAGHRRVRRGHARLRLPRPGPLVRAARFLRRLRVHLRRQSASLDPPPVRWPLDCRRLRACRAPASMYRRVLSGGSSRRQRR